MSADAKTPGGFSLRRWSRRKLEATREAAPSEARSPVAPANAPAERVPIASTPVAPGPVNESALPPVESLTSDSDFTAYLQPNVDESVKRQALKKMFTDPRFNVMDGLDVYIDDYTKTVPIPPEVLEQLMKTSFSFNPPPVPHEVPPGPAAGRSIEIAPVAPAIATDPAAPAVPALNDTTSSPTPVATLPRSDTTDELSGAPETRDPMLSR